MEKLPRALVNRLLAHAQRFPDREVCGLVAATDDEPSRCYPIPNNADAPDRLFAMEPAAQLQAMKRMREHGERLYAIYHSHPETLPVPSQRDLEAVGYPEALYLIISLGTRGVLEMRGWRLTGEQPEAVAIGIRD
ncbi:MAG: M67 family metallopeptidase [Gammaproteobacteria bacterium]|jgi:proteasome lid subunit RPN8/RPN11